MAKIDEITALLIDELESFEKAINTLKKEYEKIKNVKLSVDTSLLNQEFSKIMQVMSEEYLKQRSQLELTQKKLNKIIIFPKWMIILFSSFFFIFIISFFFSFYQFKNIENLKERANEAGKQEIISYMQQFFEENPKALDTYNEWKTK